MKKKERKTLDPAKEARRRARKSGLAPSATKVIVDKRSRPPKHKKSNLEPDAY